MGFWHKLNVTQFMNDESASTGVSSKQKESSAGFSIPDSVKSFPSVHFVHKSYNYCLIKT